jgi:alkanesulfonate monooxygenase SsuD/methylene tetrahydromethanopterin reductase-like flavin-dependent oxidoreductase (luciferase family)
VVDAQFRPRPLQQPRIPIWVGGTWPNRRPFRRAARWDGMFPIFDGVEQGEMPSPEAFGEAVSYTRSHRAAGPFDAALEGQTEGVDATADAERVEPYVRAGLTWWVEALNWSRGSVAEVRDRIRRGPPSS